MWRRQADRTTSWEEKWVLPCLLEEGDPSCHVPRPRDWQRARLGLDVSSDSRSTLRTMRGASHCAPALRWDTEMKDRVPLPAPTREDAGYGVCALGCCTGPRVDSGGLPVLGRGSGGLPVAVTPQAGRKERDGHSEAAL